MWAAVSCKVAFEAASTLNISAASAYHLRNVDHIFWKTSALNKSLSCLPLTLLSEHTKIWFRKASHTLKATTSLRNCLENILEYPKHVWYYTVMSTSSLTACTNKCTGALFFFQSIQPYPLCLNRALQMWSWLFLFFFSVLAKIKPEGKQLNLDESNVASDIFSVLQWMDK